MGSGLCVDSHLAQGYDPPSLKRTIRCPSLRVTFIRVFVMTPFAHSKPVVAWSINGEEGMRRENTARHLKANAVDLSHQTEEKQSAN